ncbi:bifunctional DNA-directed RNA polymerase [Babesia duncani]|uniref:Bifunctional DNA-directed RNA polymerase n=1 Tax=Babesia duncani TaxID=323732 RepID=A0AAD9UMN5_9APIC|nr:bifunctional DNA-directed RNA polymerase [Babesia duncani]
MANFVTVEASGVKTCYHNGYETANLSVYDQVKGVEIRFMKKTKLHSIAEIRGLNVALANAIRRILLVEVPTLAIDTVHIKQNTGVIQDEVLAHRIGLIPFDVDPDNVVYRNHDELNAENSIKFELNVACKPEDLGGRSHMPVYASHLKWEPSSEAERAAFGDNPPKPVYGDVLLTKLGPGQRTWKRESVKSTQNGRQYQLQSIDSSQKLVRHIVVCQWFLEFSNDDPLTIEEKQELCSICPMNVFSFENGDVSIENPMNCTSCRACVERFPKRVLLKKINNHFIFSVESTGAIPSYTLFLKAIAILKEKAVQLRRTVLKLDNKGTFV